MPKSTVYGPVASWRLGRSLGIDLLCTEQKTCNFDCVYCQLGPNAKPVTERQEFVQLTKLSNDVQAAKGAEADLVTFAGRGEPTLASNLGPAINLVKSALGLPVAVFTNGAMLKREDVRRDLCLADIIIVKMDAPDARLFERINRPAPGIQLSDILQGLQLLGLEFKGKLMIDVMLTDLNRGYGNGLQFNVRCGIPDQVHLNTPLRQSSMRPLRKEEVEDVRKNWFWNLKAITVYDPRKPMQVVALDEVETEARQPTKPKGAAQPSGTPPASRII